MEISGGISSVGFDFMHSLIRHLGVPLQKGSRVGLSLQSLPHFDSAQCPAKDFRLHPSRGCTVKFEFAQPLNLNWLSLRAE